MRQWSAGEIHAGRLRISELPMRQWSPYRPRHPLRALSELPMRQWSLRQLAVALRERF